jgi:hypothetical protein
VNQLACLGTSMRIFRVWDLHDTNCQVHVPPVNFTLLLEFFMLMILALYHLRKQLKLYLLVMA